MTASTIDLLQTDRFLSDLYGDLDRGAVSLGELRNGHFTTIGRYALSNPDWRAALFDRAAKANQTGGDIYVQINPVRAGLSGHARGTTADTIGLTALYADLDVGKDKAPATTSDVLEIVRALPLPPSTIVATSWSAHDDRSSLQAFWLLKEAEMFDRVAERADAQALVRAWQGTINAVARQFGDYAFDATHDLARQFRLPGLIYWDPKGIFGHDRFVQTISEGGPRHTLGDFEPYLAAAASDRSGDIPAPKEGKRKLSEDQIAQLVDALVRFWIAGRRHSIALAVGGLLANSGVAEVSALEVVRRCCEQAGDQEPQDRQKAVCSSYAKLRAGCRPLGWLRLKELVDDEAHAAIDAVLHPGDGDDDDPNAGAPEGKRKPSQATQLAELAHHAGVELFHDANTQAFASIVVDGHRETWPVRSSGFRTYLQASYFKAHRSAANAAAMQDALATLEGIALFEGPQRTVSVRTAAAEDESIYLDLGDAEWRAVHITRDGWEVVADPPVAFQRSKTSRPLPYPEVGGRLSDLGDFINVTDGIEGSDFLLVAGFAVQTLMPTGSYPIVDFCGEQGGGKTTAARVLRRLTDPRQVEVTSFPREDGDWATMAANTQLLALDNVSHVSDDNADKLCRTATGGGIHKRKLYTDDEEHAVDVTRPVILTGIPDLSTRPDLADRTLAIELPSLRGKIRRSEAQFWIDFEAAAPKLFGALLDAAVLALRNLPSIDRDDLPRMADFARLGEAILPAFGRESGAFVDAMRANAGRQNLIILEAYPEMSAILRWSEKWADDEKVQTASTLFGLLNELVPLDVRKSSSWPKSVRTLTTNLRRVAPNLYAAGLAVTFERESHQRWIRLRRLSPETIRGDASSASSASSNGAAHDANDARNGANSGITSNGHGDTWICPACGLRNQDWASHCYARTCREPRPAKAGRPAP